jgi:hypothetical protein
MSSRAERGISSLVSGPVTPCALVPEGRTSGMRSQLLATVLALVFAPHLAGQNWPGRSVRLVPNGVEILDNAGVLPRRIFTDTTAWAVLTPSVSPNGELLGVVRMEAGVIEGTGYGVPPYPTTVVLDSRTGAARLRIPGAYAFAWCGVSCVAVLYGVYSEDSEVGPYGDSAAVYDVTIGRRRFVLHRELGAFFAPRWISRDSSVIFGGYYGGPKVSLQDGSQHELNAPSPNESGSGRWVIETGPEMPTAVVRPRDGSVDSIAIPLEGRWQVEEWLGRTDKILLLFIPPRRPPRPGEPTGVRPRPPRDPNAPPADRTYRIWDVATGTVSEEWKAAETAWRGPAPNGCRLFLKDGGLTAAPGCR